MGIHLVSVSLSETERQIARNGIEALTNRETEILNQLLNARSTKTIADQYGISVFTVQAHKTNIKNKLGVSSVRDIYRVMLGLQLDMVLGS